MLLLGTILIASISLFWMRFGPVLRNIRGARATPDFDLQPLGPRIRQFIWEVMLQGNVIRQRPLPGLAHAFVFWGFCAFALITINHVAAGFGVSFLSPHSALGGSISVSSRCWRWRWRSRSPGSRSGDLWCGRDGWAPVSPESGFIALLIFLLMVTYLAGMPGWGFGEASPAGKSELVAAHAGAGGVPAADSAHQAPAPGAESR